MKWYLLVWEENINAIIGPFDSEELAKSYRKQPSTTYPDVSFAHIGGGVFSVDGPTPSSVIAPSNGPTYVWGAGFHENY